MPAGSLQARVVCVARPSWTTPVSSAFSLRPTAHALPLAAVADSARRYDKEGKGGLTWTGIQQMVYSNMNVSSSWGGSG